MLPDADPLAAVSNLSGVAGAVARARGAMDELLGHRVLRRSSALVSTESALRGAVASAALDGEVVPLDRVRDLLRAGEHLPDAHADAVLQGALRVSAELGALTSTWGRAPRQVLARLHVLAAADLLDHDQLGRPRTSGEVSERLAALVELLTTKTSAPALVVAAVVHAELLAVRPFAAANGVVARAAQRLVLVSRGFDPKALCPADVGHLELGPAYPAALADYARGTPAGVAAWVGHCAAAIVLGAREGMAVCEAIQRGG